MSEQNFFRNKEEELQRLTQEIADLKSTMKDMAASLSRIERHVKRSFGISPKAKPSVKNKPTRNSMVHKKEEPTITSEKALKLFDEFSENWDTKNPSLIKDKLQEMTLPNLKLMAHELGVTFKSKPSKKTLCEGIMGRLNERAMLSRNVNVTSSIKDSSIDK
jgi:hypothetical protein